MNKGQQKSARSVGHDWESVKWEFVLETRCVNREIRIEGKDSKRRRV